MARRRSSILSTIIIILLVLTLILVLLYILNGEGSSDIAVGNVEFHFIDVGQGDAALIRTPEGDIIIDAGPGKHENDLKKYLDSCGVRVIKYAIFTHPHEDHIGGADTVLRNYTVENVILPDYNYTTQAYKTMVTYIEAEKCNVYEAVANDVYTLGDFKMTLLSPHAEADYEDNTNNYSVVLKAEWGNTSAIFTGDAEKEAEANIISTFSADFLKSDILKVGHHGSYTSTSAGFLKAVSPKIAVISCGRNNEYGHPHRETMNSLTSPFITVRRTDTEGSIVYVSDGTKVSEYNAK